MGPVTASGCTVTLVALFATLIHGASGAVTE
jgi:hypothetical protein